MNTEATASTPAKDIIGSRIGAALVDMVLVIIVLVVFTIFFGDSSGGSSDDGGTSFSFNLSGLPFIAYALVTAAYYFIMEATKGQTLGKMLFSVKVVSGKGGAPTTLQIGIRTALRLIDGLLFYLPALIAILASSKKQRIGDMLADTLVVKA